MTTRWAIAVCWVCAVLASACDASPTSPTTAPSSPAASYSVTTLSFTSDANDFVGQGRSEAFTLQNASFAANVHGNGGYLSIVIRPATASPSGWHLIVDAPNDTRIVPGTYRTARDFGSNQWTVDFGGDGRSCGAVTGTVIIHAFDFIPENQALKHFRASFEQHCEGRPAALRGEVAILADPWR